jgi:hypothetical protein
VLTKLLAERWQGRSMRLPRLVGLVYGNDPVKGSNTLADL